ncbi:sigma factor-like helix-turn-helix DNA-binding protein [Nocardia sp. NPDC051929]|uniref:sigma factor-like helix-turn-helix DNA-binding protein n=1 Tax=Nocardia sp. NPDC051929 TaxID=3364327 RepID=UPI0037C8B9B8
MPESAFPDRTTRTSLSPRKFRAILTYREVATDFGVPIETVSTRVHYALLSLRKPPGRI